MLSLFAIHPSQPLSQIIKLSSNTHTFISILNMKYAHDIEKMFQNQNQRKIKKPKKSLSIVSHSSSSNPLYLDQDDDDDYDDDDDDDTDKFYLF